MTIDLIKRWLICCLTFCIFLSVSGYIGDLLLRFNLALKNVTFLFVYVLVHLFQLYVFGPVLLLYFWLFKNAEKHVMIKSVLLLLAAILMGSYLRPDDWNMITGKYGNMKQIFIYPFSAVCLVLFDQYFLMPIIYTNTPKSN
jgi:hypothetical protein